MRPSILFKLAEHLISGTSISGTSDKARSLYLLPANGLCEPLVQQFCAEIFELTRGSYGVKLITARHIRDTVGIRATRPEVASRIEEWSEQYDLLILIGCPENVDIDQIFLEHCERIYIVGDGEQPPTYQHHVDALIQNPNICKFLRKELILLYSDTLHSPHNTHRWLMGKRFDKHHHVRLYRQDDLKRMARFFLGIPLGVCFSGGGARGWAYSGVLRAFLEEKIPIDICAGTSSGSFAATYMGLYSDLSAIDHLLDTISAVMNEALQVKNLTLPTISIASSKPFSEMLSNFAQGANIEDLWTNTYVVSCNLTERKVHIHRNGSVYEAIRASASLPGLFPPVTINGNLHVDGGVLNNTPVDVLRSFMGDEGIIVTLSLGNTQQSVEHYHFPEILTKQYFIKNALKGGEKRDHFPSLIGFLFESLTVGAEYYERENIKRSDLVIAPHLEGYSMVDVGNGQTVAEAGYLSASKALRCWKRENPSFDKKWLFN